MRRVPVLVAGALGAVACSQQALPPPAHILGTNALVVVDDLVFVTSPGASELRALNLRASPRDFVRAPNPLEPLSVPVLNAPTNLARDIYYTPDGDIDDSRAPYVYVQGAASAEISIVGTQRDTQLVELARVLADGIVTAIAARGPSPDEPRSTLYYATLNQNQGRLWQLKVPPSNAAGKMTDVLPQATPVSYGPGGADSGRVGGPISSLVVMPGGRLAVASRIAQSNVGRTVLLDATQVPGQQRWDLNGQQWELDFRAQTDGSPPRPFRQLVTHATVYRTADDGSLSVVLPAGARVLGVQDDDACGASPDCPGVLAVDALPGAPRFSHRSLDASGYEMAPIRWGGGLISAVGVGPPSGRSKPGVALAFPSGVRTIDLLGVATTASGLINFFDAAGLSLFNGSQSGPAQAMQVQYRTDQAIARDYVEGPILGAQQADGPANPEIKVALGAAIDETVYVTYQGTLPGFRDVPVPAPGLIGGEQQLLPGPGDLHRLVPGSDRIVVTAGSCSSEVGLRSIERQDPRTPNSPLVLKTSDPISCAGSATFSMRAGGDLPYVVEGGATGYMGRTGNSQTFAFPASPGERAARYFYHPPPDSTPRYDPTAPQLQFTMGPGDPLISRDFQYLLAITSGYAPEFVSVNTALGIEFHAPGSAAYVGALADGTDVSRLYIAYPAANAIVEFVPDLLVPNNPNDRFLTIFR